MIIGANPRKEAPVLNARIRKRWRAGNLKIGVIGEKADLTYDYAYLGAGPETLADLRRITRTAKLERQIWLIGQGALARPDGAAILVDGGEGRAVESAPSRTAGTASRCCTPRRRASARSISASCRRQGGIAAAEMAKAGALDVLFLLGADEIDIAPGAFIVYIGTHGDSGAHRADVILPGAAYTEKSGLYVNTEGRVQMAARAAFPAGRCARGLGDPARAVRRARRRSCPTTRSRQLRAALFKAHPHLARVDQIAPGNPADIEKLAERGGTPDKAPFRSPDRRLLSDQSDRARVRHHGRMLGARARARARRRRSSAMAGRSSGPTSGR